MDRWPYIENIVIYVLVALLVWKVTLWGFVLLAFINCRRLS